jgi:hypothetical protein
MARPRPQDASRVGAPALLFLVFVVFLFVFFLRHVPIFIKIFVLFFGDVVIVFVFVEVIGDRIQRDWMSLRNLQFGFTLRAAEDLALFYLVFVHINFSGTFWAAEHGCIPPK